MSYRDDGGDGDGDDSTMVEDLEEEAGVNQPRTLGEMLTEIEHEKPLECGMKGRIASMDINKLKIYVFYLEKKRYNPATTQREKAGVEEILRAAYEGLEAKAQFGREPEPVDEAGRHIKAVLERKKAVADEKVAVLKYARKKCAASAVVELDKHEAKMEHEWKLAKPDRLKAARIRQNLFWLSALLSIGVGACQQIYIGSLGGAVGGAGVFLAVVFYLAAVGQIAAGYLFGPDKLPTVYAPMEPKQREEKLDNRTQDLLSKWQNEQRAARQKEKSTSKARRDKENKLQDAHDDHLTKLRKKKKPPKTAKLAGNKVIPYTAEEEKEAPQPAEEEHDVIETPAPAVADDDDSETDSDDASSTEEATWQERLMEQWDKEVEDLAGSTAPLQLPRPNVEEEQRRRRQLPPSPRTQMKASGRRRRPSSEPTSSQPTFTDVELIS